MGSRRRMNAIKREAICHERRELLGILAVALRRARHGAIKGEFVPQGRQRALDFDVSYFESAFGVAKYHECRVQPGEHSLQFIVLH
jgi:hypothetical protein